MQAARNHEVTVRQFRAKRIPPSNRGNRAAVRLSSQWAREEKTLVSMGGKYDNVMDGSSWHVTPQQGCHVEGVGVCPATYTVYYSNTRIKQISNNIYSDGFSLRKLRKVQFSAHGIGFHRETRP